MNQLDLFGASSPLPVPRGAYFALRPDAQAARPMENLAYTMRRRLDLTGRVYRFDRLHVSLCPIGRWRGDLEAAIAAAGGVRASPFPVVFDMVSTFGGGEATCLVLRSSRPIAALDRLRDQLRSMLLRSSISPGRQSFAAHVTLVRPAPRLPDFRLDHPIGWTVRDFVLALTGRGRAYDLARWTCR